MPGPRTSVVVLLATASLFGSGLATSPADAAARPRVHRPQVLQHRTGVAVPATTPVSTIDVVVPLHVAPAARRAVDQLAHAHLTRTARRARLRALAPTPDHAGAVRRWASRRGFTVTASTPWSVSLRGQAGALATAFGSPLRTTTFKGKRFVTTRGSVQVPAALAGLADPVVGLDTRPLYRSHDLYGGGDVQVLTSTPIRGKTAGAGATVATVNLSGWHPSDLTTYRRAAFGSGDVAPTTTNVVVGSGHVTATALEDDYGFEPEVALDAEAIAGVAPAASQRMYFGGNSSADYLAILEQMATDLETSPGAFQTASTSWGLCELDLDSSTLTAMSNAITRITAAGGTFFAASGDGGAFDCGDGETASVDFPAAAQNTVAVGGTSVSGQAPTYGNTAWEGSGGGCSVVVPAPTRQATTGSPCLGRSVPDIATLADPETGFWIYDAFDEWVPAGGTSLAAPASAAGLADAMAHDGLTTLATGNFLESAYAHPSAFTDVTSGNNGLYRAAIGYDLVTGLGTPRWNEIEAALSGNQVAAPTGTNEPLLAVDPTYENTMVSLDNDLPYGGTANGFVPNGEPTNGYAAGVTTTSCASTSTTPPSTVSLTGVEGTVELSLSIATSDPAVPGGCVTVQRPVVVDTRSPALVAPTVTYTGTTSPSYRFSWAAATDPSPSSGIIGYVAIVRDLTADTVEAIAVTTGRTFPYAGTAPLPVTPGHRYRIEVIAVDRALNSGSGVTTWTAPLDDTKATLSKHLSNGSYVSDWSRARTKYDYLGSHVVSGRKGASFAFGFTAKTVTLGVVKSPYGGYADVYLDGVKKTRISLYSSGTRYRQLVRVVSLTTRGTHKVKVVVTGVHPSASKGNLVYLDSIALAG